MIDVAGAALLGAAARNAAGVIAVCRPEHYPSVLEELQSLGQVSADTRYRLAADAFSTVAAYYAEIAAYLNQISNNVYPQRLALVLEKVSDLPYGENPHQRAAFYRETTHRSRSLADATQLAGSPPTFNNLLDLDAAYRIATRLHGAHRRHHQAHGPRGHRLRGGAGRGVSAGARHGRGVLVRRDRGREPGARRRDGARDRRQLLRGRHRARVLSRRPSGSCAASPAWSSSPCRPPRQKACATTASRAWTSSGSAAGCWSRRSTRWTSTASQLQVVTRRHPTLGELTDLLFAWRAVRHVRSNAIVLARNGATVGIGAAQASRSVSVDIALRRAGVRAKLSVMASDAYFPFPDGIQIAANAGVTAIIQPGGSIRDEMAIEVADRHHLAMVFTGRRHFRH